MTMTGIATAVMAGTLVVLAVFLVPAVIEIRRTLTALRTLIANTDTELKPILSELQGTLADLKVVTEGVAGKVEDVQVFMDAVGDTGRNIRTINSAISGVAQVAATSTIWATGARVAGKYLIERITKKRG
ncbi:MAG: DUF948 domain-containing protein [Desulfuromonadales bacterium]|nr:MAG: DUF948 domain-containing protein [Desulfuromonadales bacterium]